MAFRDDDPTLNPLQDALLNYHSTDLEDALITWSKEHWPMAARAMIYNKKEGDDLISGVQGLRDEQARHALSIAARLSVSQRELTMRTIAAVLPGWLEERYGLTPKDAQEG